MVAFAGSPWLDAVIVGLLSSARALGSRCTRGYAGGNSVSRSKGATVGRAAATSGILIGVRARSSDNEASAEWGRSSGRQWRQRYEHRQAPERAARVPGSCAAAGRRANWPARSTAGRARWARTTSAPTPPGCAAGSTASIPASPFRGSSPSCSPSASAASSPSRTSACAPPTSHRPCPASTCPGPGPRRSPLLSEFSRSDLMLARRGFLGTSLALSAGPLPDRAHAALAGARARGRARHRRRPAGARPPLPALEAELELLESTTAMFRQWDAQCGGGLRRKAVVGQLHEVTDLLQEPQPAATAQRLFQVRRRTGRAGRLDELRRRSPAHRPEVLRARPARRQGSRATSRSARTSCPP